METSLHSPLFVTTLGASQRSLPPKFFVQYLDQWLIVDLRCSQLYSLGHIKGSRNLPLNKKKLLNVQLSELYLHKCLRKLSKFINERLKKKQVCYIVLYDHSSTETTVWNPIWKLHNRCQQQMFQGCSFFVLNGGFSLFSNLYPRHTVSCQVIECSRKTQALIPLLRCSVFQDSFPCEELVAHFPGIYEYKQLMIRDLETQDLHPFLDEAIAFIEKVKLSGRILVHCYAGVSRSAAVVLAYLIYLGNTFEEAWKFLIVQKSDVQPLGNFILQLKQYEERWKSLQDAV
ncbi:Dual specificity protein phosphatase 4 [Galdieria sulphuraria]|nr:Dual specificity protein phosphatase 4 [Galdieria sulphuraria]